MIHTVKGFGIVNKAEIMVFWNSLDFSMIQWMLAIWSLVLLPFLKLAWTSGSSRFTYYWSLAWRILSISYSSVRWVPLCDSLSILWDCLSLGLEWKQTFSSPEATVEFSKFADILSATLSQHHLLGFEIAQLGVWTLWGHRLRIYSVLFFPTVTCLTAEEVIKHR